MSIRNKNAIIGGLLWTIILLSTIVFFTPIISFIDNSRISKVIGSICILSGIVLDIIFRFRNQKEVEDERVLKVQSKAVMSSSITTLSINFFLLLALYNFSNGVVDAEWLWFIAYFTFALYFTLGNLLYYFYDTMGENYEG